MREYGSHFSLLDLCLAPCFWATDLGFLQYGFWNRLTHVECLMRPCVIVLPEPVIDDDLRLLGRRTSLERADWRRICRLTVTDLPYWPTAFVKIQTRSPGTGH